MSARQAPERTLVTIDVAELVRLQSEAQSRGAADARALCETLQRCLTEREAYAATTLAARDALVGDLHRRNEALSVRLEAVAEKTAQLAVIDAQRQVATARAEASKEMSREGVTLLRDVMSEFRGALPGGKTSVPGRVKSALERLFADTAACDAVQNAIGTGDFVALAEWAQAI